MEERSSREAGVDDGAGAGDSGQTKGAGASAVSGGSVGASGASGKRKGNGVIGAWDYEKADVGDRYLKEEDEFEWDV